MPDASEHTARIHVPPSTDQTPPARPAVAQVCEKTVLVREAASERTRPATPVAGSPTFDDLFQCYAILGKIGDGGMGIVYLARDKRLGRFVAIKRLNAKAQSVALLRQRFLQEARAVAALSHIYIVHIYALGEDHDGPYIVMEYIAGPDVPAGSRPAMPPMDERPTAPLTLDQFVSRHGQISVPDAVDLLVKIGRAVAYAHGCGVIHRDLKPSNVLLDKSNEPKIVDFGLARLRRDEEQKLTVPGEKLLSIGYGAPEQEQDASLSDERADVYGLGAILYFAITGQNPRYFREQDIPVPLRDILVKALATDREQRFPTAAAFTEALQATRNKTRIEIPTVKTTWRCKWCDTVNPLSLRFCAECGWDGGETCPECGADTFVGQQFCGTCGADGRAYEAFTHAVQRIHAALEGHQFDRVLSLAGRIHTFEAAGPSGRRLQKEVQTLREQAEKRLTRRDELREQIPLELRAGNYERALDFIREIRTLDENTKLYEEDERRLPELTLARDLTRARRALRQRDWRTAAHICQDLLRNHPEHPDCLRLHHRLSIHRWFHHAAWSSAAAVLLSLVYVLSLPPAARATHAPFSSFWRLFYRPAWTCYAAGPLAGMLDRYQAAWDRPDLASYLSPATTATSGGIANVPLPSELQHLQDSYNQQLQDLAAEQRRYSDVWPKDYIRELSTLADRRQTAGDYEGLVATKAELKQFYASRQIGDPPTGGDFAELTQTIIKYRDLLASHHNDRCRRLVNTTKKYINDLSDMQRTFTREGRMEPAAAVNAEIRRVQGGSELQESEAELAATVTASPVPVDSTTALPPMPPDRILELATLRSRYQEQLDGIASDYARKLEEWPFKYRAALTNLMTQFKQQGGYDDWNTAKGELDRFEADRQINEKDVVVQPPRLAKLQHDYHELLTQYRKVRAQSTVKAAEESMGRLEELQKNLTRSGKMEQAAAVNAEIKQMRSNADYVSARQELTPPPDPNVASNHPPAAVTATTTNKPPL